MRFLPDSYRDSRNAKSRIKAMGIFNKIFGGRGEIKAKKELPWISLNNISQLKHIEEKSKTRTQILFKYSTRCGISSMVMRQFVDNYPFIEKELDLYYLDLIAYRNISNEVGYKFQVMHESPQLLVIKNGVVVAHASHGAVNDLDLSRFV